ncbi:MAG: HtaA domain-containing protein [Acidimicrobiia bacterium]
MRTTDQRTARGRPRRVAALATATAMAAGALLSSVAPASAEPLAVTDATIEWGISNEVGQSAPPFGGCNYLSAGVSDGTQAQYLTTDGNVSVLKNGAAPTWANKCEGAAAGQGNQTVRWSGGTGTVDPDTGAATLSFTGRLSINFYGGLVPFTIENPVLTVDADGDGQLVATLFGYGSSMENPNVKVPLDPVAGIVVADLSGVDAGATGFTVTPDYEGVEYEPPAESGGTPQNRVNPGWGSWPASFVDFHYLTGLTSYWYSSGGAADPKKAPSALSISYTTDGGGDPDPDPDPDPEEGTQTITATVPEVTEPGELVWSINGDGAVDLGTTTNQGTFLQAGGAIDPISLTDTRAGGPAWSISGQVSDFTGGISGSHLGWSPEVLSPGAGAVAGGDVASSLAEGGTTGLSVPSVLAASPGGHASGTASLGAGLDLRLPVETPAGSYSATLTITALT